MSATETLIEVRDLLASLHDRHLAPFGRRAAMSDIDMAALRDTIRRLNEVHHQVDLESAALACDTAPPLPPEHERRLWVRAQELEAEWRLSMAREEAALVEIEQLKAASASSSSAGHAALDALIELAPEWAVSPSRLNNAVATIRAALGGRAK